jgi:hypothetical protein
MFALVWLAAEIAVDARLTRQHAKSAGMVTLWPRWTRPHVAAREGGSHSQSTQAKHYTCTEVSYGCTPGGWK